MPIKKPLEKSSGYFFVAPPFLDSSRNELTSLSEEAYNAIQWLTQVESILEK
jgi:hypothetical protein